jgi:hypothetical protein
MNIKNPKLTPSKLVQLFLLACISGTIYTSTPAIANTENSQQAPESVPTSVKSKKQLAKEVIKELGIGRQYDLYFWNSVDIIQGTATRNKFSNWLQKLLARVAGWKYVEADYVSVLETKFSEAELQELLELAKRPLMKKLLRAEIQAYEQTGDKRSQLLWKAWEDYNSGRIYVPNNLWK